MRVNECKECWVRDRVGGSSSHPLSQRTRARLEYDVLRRRSQRHHRRRLRECHRVERATKGGRNSGMTMSQKVKKKFARGSAVLLVCLLLLKGLLD